MGYDTQGKNVKVTVGPSETYDSNDPVCTEIAQLVQQTGSTLVEYACDRGEAAGEYVKFSTDQRFLTICEAKVFVKQGMRTEYVYQINLATYHSFQIKVTLIACLI